MNRDSKLSERLRRLRKERRWAKHRKGKATLASARVAMNSAKAP